MRLQPSSGEFMLFAFISWASVVLFSNKLFALVLHNLKLYDLQCNTHRLKLLLCLQEFIEFLSSMRLSNLLINQQIDGR